VSKKKAVEKAARHKPMWIDILTKIHALYPDKPPKEIVGRAIQVYTRNLDGGSNEYAILEVPLKKGTDIYKWAKADWRTRQYDKLETNKIKFSTIQSNWDKYAEECKRANNEQSWTSIGYWPQ